jgi:hypothetical protein
MKYRIIKETNNDNIQYYLEQKQLFFWWKVCHVVFNYVLYFETVEEAEEEAKKLIYWNRPITTTRTIVKILNDN